MPYETYANAPLVIEDLDTGDLICDPDVVKSTTIQYFQRLFHCSPTLSTPKPWLDSPAVQEVHNQVLASPFNWPQPMTLDEL